MTSSKILIIDDDLNFILELEMLLHDLGHSVLPSLSVPTTFEEYTGEIPDLVLIDLYFGTVSSGTDLVGNWQSKGVPAILLTRSKEFTDYENSRSKMPGGYLTKPFSGVTLQAAIDKALLTQGGNLAVANLLDNWKKYSTIKSHIFVRHSGSMVKILIQEISYLEADGNYCYIYMDKGNKFAVKSSLRRFKNLLSNQGFVQVNRGHLVNFDSIREVKFPVSELILNTRKLVIGDAYRKEIEDWMNKI